MHEGEEARGGGRIWAAGRTNALPPPLPPIIIARRAVTPNERPGPAIMRLRFLSTAVTAAERNAQFGALASPNGEEFKRIQTFTIPGVQFLRPSCYHAIAVNMICATLERGICRKASLSGTISNHSYGSSETFDRPCNCGDSRNYAIRLAQSYRARCSATYDKNSRKVN